jgi:hypothetical protein
LVKPAAPSISRPISAASSGAMLVSARPNASRSRGEVDADAGFDVSIAREEIEGVHAHLRINPELAVDPLESAAGQPMNAAVDGVVSAGPRLAHSAERKIMLDDRGRETAGSRVAACRETSQAAR